MLQVKLADNGKFPVELYFFGGKLTVFVVKIVEFVFHLTYNLGVPVKEFNIFVGDTSSTSAYGLEPVSTPIQDGLV